MDTVYTVQRSLYTLYNLLPIVIIVTLLTVGFGLGNYGMITILLGQFAISACATLVHLLPFSNITGKHGQLFSLFPGEVSKQFPSMWITNITFFFGCLIGNALNLYRLETTATGSDEAFASKVNNRKSRSLMIIVICSLVAIFLVGYRALVEGVDLPSLVRTVISIIIGSVGSIIWYLIIQQPNMGIKNMDIFGISQQLIHVTQTEIKTMCELKA